MYMSNLDTAMQSLRERLSAFERRDTQPSIFESALVTRLAAAEGSVERMGKLIQMLQGDLDEEINTRKQLETELTRLKKIVQVLQQ